MDPDTRETLQHVLDIAAAWGLHVLGALTILILGLLASGWAARAADAAMARTGRVEVTLRHFLTGVIRYTIVVVTVIAVLERFGVATTSFIAVLGAVGLAIALAFQGTLGHIAAGIMLLLFRPFRVGQFIEAAGVTGTVERISLFMTELNSPENVHIVIPNGDLWGKAVKNYSHNPTRRVDIAVGIDYGDDIGKAFEIIRGLLDADERALKEPAAEMMVSNLGDNAVEIQVWAWAKAADVWPLKFDLTRRIKEAFDAGGITIPFPQRTVHITKDT